MCAKRVERDQATIEKEQLKEAMSTLKEREVERERQFLRLQEKMHLLEEELVRSKLSKEHLVDQRCESIFELVKARGAAANAAATERTISYAPGFTPQPYGMPQGWNANMKDQ
ncbi:hypothetical protein CR513_36017, partial [Mucuna pruriens]